MTLVLLLSLVTAMAVETPRTLHRHWNKPQSQFFLTRATPGGAIEEIDLEGAVRAGKSTPAVEKLIEYGTQAFPGIHMAATRWTQDGLDAQVKPLWRDTARTYGLTLHWHPDEEYDEIVGSGSRVYLRALKAAEQTNRYGKLAGLTLAILWIDQPEEVPADVVNAYVPARLSQVGFPHEAWYTPNPPGHGHWLSKRFPEDNALAHHTYIRTSVYDNRHNLGDAYIADLERAYPVGSVLRRRFIDGKRGLNVTGKPVYGLDPEKGPEGAYFDRDRHTNRALAMNPALTLIECWDYGYHRPCVVWLQFTPWGGLHVLGGVMGEDLYLEDFAPIALQQRAQWFPSPLEIASTADPAGENKNSQGTNRTGLDVLRDVLGYKPRAVPNANAPEMRDFAIQSVATYLRRRALRGGEAFQVHPSRWLIVSASDATAHPWFVDALEAGYVWDERVVRTSRGKAIQVPLKDRYYEHGMNCLEYGVLAYGPAMPTQGDEQKIRRELEARAKRDHDPDDLPTRPSGARTIRRGIGRGHSRRGGY